MKILIEVSEKDYLDFMLQYDNDRLDENIPFHRAKIAIAEGTPLPNGHGRLIDADALKKKATMCPTVGNAETLLLDISDVENAPTIIEADKEGAEDGKND